MNMLKKLNYTLLIVICSLILTGCTNSEEKIQIYNSLIREADAYYEQRGYTNALEKYNEAAKLIPEDDDAYKGIINILVDKQRLADAANLLEESGTALSTGERSKLYTRLANTFYEINNFESAEKYYLKADSGIDNYPAKLGLAKTYLKLGNIPKAEKYLKVSDPEISTFYETSLIRAYLKGADKVEIKAAVKDLDDLEQEESSLVVRYTSLLASANSLTEDELFSAAIMAKEYIDSGYPYLALQILEEKKEDMTEYGDGWFLLGRAYFELGKYDDAITALGEASSLDIHSAEAYKLIARSYYLVGDVDSSIEFYDRSIAFAKDSTKIEIYMEYIEMLKEEEQYAKALTALDELADLSDLSWTQLSYIDVYYAQGNSAKVDFHIGKLAEMELSEEDTLQYLRWKITYDLEAGDTDKVPSMLEDLKGYDKYNPYYYLLNGRLAFSLGDNEEAKENWEKAIEYDLDGEVTESALKLLSRVE
jgi:tetratricopeptide (TPR) repeat protein